MDAAARLCLIAGFFSAMLAASEVKAEGGCPPGHVPVPGPNGQAMIGCAPLPGGGGEASAEQAPVPTGKWIYTWGAIAISDSGTGGSAVGKLSKSQAKQDALRSCAEAGDTGCRIAYTYHHQCVAIAQAKTNPQRSSITAGGSKESAMAKAMDMCRSSGEDCQIFYSACSEPIFKPY